jgi:hypothetical protein
MSTKSVMGSLIWKDAMRDGFKKVLIGCLIATTTWFGLLVVLCYVRQSRSGPLWMIWIAPCSTVAVWNSLLLAPAGLALGNIAGFFMASYGKEQTRLNTFASQLPALFGVAVGVDALRGPESYVVRLLERVGAACETPAALVAIILLIFFVIGFLFMYMLKAAFINPLVEGASPELIRDVQLQRRVEDEGVGRLPAPMPRKVERQSAASKLETRQIVENDPQKGKWGGSPINQGYLLTSMVQPLPGNSELFEVVLQVQSLDEMRPLVYPVQFHLHPTFADPSPKVKPANGIAKLSRLAWGAFTVGAEVLISGTELERGEVVESRRITLELDLAEVPGSPQLFVTR